MSKKWYRNPFYWLAILALMLTIYLAAYRTLGGVVMGVIDFFVNIGIPQDILIKALAALQIFTMVAIPLILFVILPIVAIVNWREAKQLKKTMNKPTIESKIDAIIEKLAITQEDILKAQKEANMAKYKPQKPYTAKQFEKLLDKASTPISEWNKPCQEGKETSESRPSDGCNGKHKSQDTTEGKRD